MLLDRVGPPGRCRGGVVMIYWFRRPRFTPFCQPYAREGQAVVCPLLRGRSPTRSVAPKQHRGLRRASLWLPSARGCRRIWRGVVQIYWFRRRDAARPDRAAWAVPRRRSYDLLVSAAPLCPPLSALRARGPGRGLPVATGSLANEIGRAKTAPGSPARFSPASLGAWVPKNLARRKRKTRRLLTNRPCSSLVYEESDSKERLRVSNWIVQRLYNYAVKKTVEL